MKGFTFSKGNRKLSKNVLIWNLPAVKTCPGSSTYCRRICYALKAERCYPSARKSRLRNFEFSKSEQFVEKIVQFLKKRKETIIRLHESGDFYNKEYLNKWCEIARQLPDKIFYAYTKSYFFDNFWDNIPDNLRIIQSVESRFPEKVNWERSTARVIEKPSERKSFEFICPEQLAKKKGKKIECMKECQLCLRKNIHVCFLRH